VVHAVVAAAAAAAVAVVVVVNVWGHDYYIFPGILCYHWKKEEEEEQ